MRHSEPNPNQIPTTRAPERRGVAMFLVMGIILLVTLLGVAGLQLSRADALASGSILDMKSRDQAAWTGINLALARMQSNPTATAAQLSTFLGDIADSLPAGSRHDRFVFTATGFTLATSSTDPQFYSLLDSAAATHDKSSAAVRLLSVDVGNVDPQGVLSSNGIVVTLQSTGRGRNNDEQTVVASYRMLGVTLQQTVVATNTANVTNALYLSGDLSNTNIGSHVNGDVYVSGNVSLNASAPQMVDGRFRVGGNFSSNAALTVTKNSWIGGQIFTNSGAPMVFGQNLGVGGGIGVMNADLTVDSSFNLYGNSSGSWNTATLRVGKQLFWRDQFKDVLGKIVVGGNAFFWNSISLKGNPTDSFRGFLQVRGALNDNTFENGDIVILGNFDVRSTTSFYMRGCNLFARRNAKFEGAVHQQNTGRVSIDTSAIFNAGIADIGNAVGDAISVGDALYLSATNQGSFNGGASAGNRMWMKGSLSPWFSQNSGNGQWRLSSTGSRSWRYQGPILSGGQNPRVLNSSQNNFDAFAMSPVVFPTLFTAPSGQPWGLTNDSIGMTPLDTMTDLSANPPDTFAVNSTKSPLVDTSKVVLTDTLCMHAGASTNNWTASDFNKIYHYLQTTNRLLNGYMVLLINSSSSLGSLNSAGGSFNGKAVFIIEKSIAVNGNWPASANSNCIQVIFVRGSGSLTQFGSQGDIYGLVYYASNGGSLTQSWGANSKLYGSMQFANGASYTGNSGNLAISLDQNVFNDITTNLPGSLRTTNPNGSAPIVSVQTQTRVMRPTNGAATRIQFVRLNEYR